MSGVQRIRTQPRSVNYHVRTSPLRSSVLESVLSTATVVAVLAVLIVLILGLMTMMRGKSANLSQKFMRWRVGLQFVAVIFIMAALYYKS